jgi:hypothetical protein
MAEFMTIRKEKSYSTRRENFTSNYRTLFRFEENSVAWMADHFLGQTAQDSRGGALSSKRKLEILLRYFADPGFQTGVAEDLGIHQTTVCKTIKEVLPKIMEKAHLWIHFPSTATEMEIAKEDWQTVYRMPCTIGAIDCTHVRIEKPRGEFEDEFINRKGFASINVQATCNALEKFTSVDVQWPGSVHDSRIWRNSKISQTMKPYNAVLLGDEGYPISQWLITPFRQPNTHQERNFNKIFTKERVIIERCFGQLKRRFPILHYKVRLDLVKIPSTIVACFVFHNIAKNLCDIDDFPEITDNCDTNSEVNAEDVPGLIQRQRGEQTRLNLMTILSNNV